MRKFLETFILFAVFGIFILISVIIAAVIGSGIISLLSLDLEEWGKIVFYIVWFLFALPLTAATLEKISNHFL